jgi:hypothetical protein
VNFGINWFLGANSRRKNSNTCRQRCSISEKKKAPIVSRSFPKFANKSNGATISVDAVTISVDQKCIRLNSEPEPKQYCPLSDRVQVLYYNTTVIIKL